MTELLSILYKLRIFTLDELSEALKGKVKSVEALLARYKQQGWIVAIRRNTYCMKDIASGLPVCDKYEIGSHLSPTACISYHTALEFHGLAHQPFNEVFVKSMTRFNPFSFDDIAKEQGFIRDNLEKVMRLVEILNYFHDSPLLSKSLVLKGGTAINLTVFQLPRLSVDIDSVDH